MTETQAAVLPSAIASALSQTERDDMRQKIIEFFSQPLKKESRITRHVRKFSPNIAVKIHFMVYETEYQNQLKAWELLDSRVIRVPRPIDYFTHHFPQNKNATGFLVMELVTTGEKVKEFTESHLDQVADMIRYLATFKGTIPGGLMGGEYGGIVFEGYPPPVPGSMQKLNEWIHKRRTRWPDLAPKPFVDFGEFELVLCHQDIAARNILWPTDGGAPWLLDWETAAYLPRFVEYYQLSLSGSKDILSRLEPLTEREQEFRRIFNVARANSVTAL